jgi:ABC-type phosphate transport system substrate-binding protein
MMDIHTFNRIGLILVGMALSLSAGGARADVVVVVSAKSPVAALSKNQIVDIFLGKSNRFPDGRPVVPIDLVEGSAVRDEFYREFADKSPAQIKAYWSKIIFTGRGTPPLEVDNGLAMKKRIIAHPNDIGYIDRDMVDGSVKVLGTP